MKINYLLILFCMMYFMPSCYKDHSATDFKLINPIKIDFGGASTTIKLFQFDTLELNPIVYKNGVSDNNMSYEWRIQSPNFDPIILANTMTLKKEITLPPNPENYELLFTVRDNTTTIEEAVRIYITVENSIGSGLFVADTKDERNSDISLISSFNFTGGYTAEDPKYFYNLYSRTNSGELIPGIIKGMQSMILAKTKTLTILTDTELHRINPSDMFAFEKNGDLFYTPIDNIKPISISRNQYYNFEFLNLDGKIYPRQTDMGGTAYAYYLFPPENHDYKISKNISVGEYYGEVYFYAFDEAKNKFYSINNSFSALLNLSKTSSTPFDPNNIGAYDALYMGEGEYESIVTVFKSETKKEYFACSFSAYENTPLYKSDLTNCINIDKAIEFISSPLSNDFFYATENSIYALSISNPIANAEERFTVEDPNDKITSMMLWRDYTMMYVSDPLNQVTGLRKNSAANKMIVITTYNETTKEGKIVVLPIIRIGDGTIDTNPKTHTTYRGFGRITSITQNKTER